MSEEQVEEERLTAIIAIRILPSWKRWLMKKADQHGISLSDYINNLINTGLEQVEGVKFLNQKSKNIAPR